MVLLTCYAKYYNHNWCEQTSVTRNVKALRVKSSVS